MSGAGLLPPPPPNLTRHSPLCVSAVLDACRALSMVLETNLAENAVVSQIQFQLCISVQPRIPLSNARKLPSLLLSRKVCGRHTDGHTHRQIKSWHWPVRLKWEYTATFICSYLSLFQNWTHAACSSSPVRHAVTCRLLIHLIAHLPLEC